MTCFLYAGRGCKRQPYGRGILQSRSHDCLIGRHEGLILLPHPVVVSAFIICSGLCACTEMLRMCVLYVSFGPKISQELLDALPWVVQCCLFLGQDFSYIMHGRE